MARRLLRRAARPSSFLRIDDSETVRGRRGSGGKGAAGLLGDLVDSRGARPEPDGAESLQVADVRDAFDVVIAASNCNDVEDSLSQARGWSM